MSAYIKKSMDTSKELLLTRYGEGVKLVVSATKYMPPSQPSVASLLALPFCVCFNSIDHISQNLNEATATVCGAISAKALIGKSIFDIASNEAASKIANNSSVAIKTQIRK